VAPRLGVCTPAQPRPRGGVESHSITCSVYTASYVSHHLWGHPTHLLGLVLVEEARELDAQLVKLGLERPKLGCLLSARDSSGSSQHQQHRGRRAPACVRGAGSQLSRATRSSAPQDPMQPHWSRPASATGHVGCAPHVLGGEGGQFRQPGELRRAERHELACRDLSSTPNARRVKGGV
jgi:hypothetical protein